GTQHRGTTCGPPAPRRLKPRRPRQRDVAEGSYVVRPDADQRAVDGHIVARHDAGSSGPDTRLLSTSTRIAWPYAAVKASSPLPCGWMPSASQTSFVVDAIG